MYDRLNDQRRKLHGSGNSENRTLSFKSMVIIQDHRSSQMNALSTQEIARVLSIFGVEMVFACNKR